MKRMIPLLSLAVIAFAVFAVASLPALAVFNMAGNGARAALIQGSVWDAGFWRVQIGNTYIAQGRAQMRAGALLSGKAAFDVTIADPSLRGDGVAILSLGGMSLEDADITVGLSRFALASGLPPGQTARIEVEDIRFDGEGRCVEARGEVSSAALMSAGESFDVALPMISGTFLCSGDQLALQLEGSNSQISLDGQIVFASSGARWRVEARASEREIVTALSILGFEQDGQDVFVLDSNQLEP